ncbi:MAG: flagellar biosynthesis regulator FlaF, partial [Pseudomonadota bacterium]
HHAQAAKTTRDTEYDAFARITSRLKAAASKGRSAYNELAEALHENRKLWTILAADVASKSNSLSPDIRARIFYLSEFTQKHSSLVLRKEASVRPLLEVNIAIMRGLRQSMATPQATRNEGLGPLTPHVQKREPERTGGVSL